ncbi:uncharacterized protein B0P05DRAFT_567036 [Gilbertella persicaria]|uniref:uncharacterized protein n=1 Tax=Gilbertella persicaria TaxID=101096 RepID=UPI0022206E0F|nr:uncharacterized protein B0P05DRAFT_567036 [Gilbertella persicaria]KAI8047053.1 hypothetical protein B0P05DRAFT_567036 [Gilbertella persicaria]
MISFAKLSIVAICLPLILASRPLTSLKISIFSITGETSYHTLTCNPLGGTHPNSIGACAKLDLVNGVLDPSGTAAMCSNVEIPVTVSITGTYQGKPLTFREDYFNDCIARTSLGALYPIAFPLDAA